jgi:hypothetical protein
MSHMVAGAGGSGSRYRRCEGDPRSRRCRLCLR